MTETILTGETDRATSVEIAIADPNATVALADEQGREAASPPNEQSCDAGEEAIRELAHRKWEAAARPAGDGIDFWLEAEREVNVERAGASSPQESGGQTC